MPLEIRELHIKVNVGDGGRQAGERAPTASGNGATENDEKEKLLAACVDEVMRILADRKER